jgi:hypothetical protein
MTKKFDANLAQRLKSFDIVPIHQVTEIHNAFL